MTWPIPRFTLPLHILTVALCAMTHTARAEDEGLIQQWQFDAAHLKNGHFAPLVGGLDATIIGPAAFDNVKPHALKLTGDTKGRHRLDITDDLAKAKLPAKTISVEAWVAIDRVQDWGGIIGALQDNGSYEKGWMLGFNGSQFFFAVATAATNKLTYLKAPTTFQPGYWYHLVGTYDGVEQRLYVDGELAAKSREQRGEIAYPPKVFYTIGAYRDDDEFYSIAGRIEQVSLFDRAITETQVAGRFATRKALFPDIDPVKPTVTDWPTYLRDNLRSGATPDSLTLPLSLRWVYKARHAPNPAWAEEAKNDYFNQKFNMPERVVYDRAFHLTGVGDRIYFGSSVDDKVYCLDADTGRERWSFHTEGPVRLAPTIHGDRALFGSDDGHVYALRTKDGSLLWKQRIGPEPRRIPGNERIISTYPVRTDVLIEEDTGYVCAGVFPNEGVLQATLDVRDGRIIETKKLDETAQGYLERAAGNLRAGTGRDPKGALVTALRRYGKDMGRAVNSLPKEYQAAFITAGDLRIGGGQGTVAAFRANEEKPVWSAAVEGRVYSLAVVRGRLLASTDKGHIYCFMGGGGGASETVVVTPPAPAVPAFVTDAGHRRFTDAADRVIALSKAPLGYCLVIGSGEGELVYELAKRTKWQVIGVEPDAAKAMTARRMLDAADLAGRTSIHVGALDALPYSDYIFNVVTTDAIAAGAPFAGSRGEALRLLRPIDGVAVLGPQASDVIVRAPLAGGGEWPYMYGDLGNTACSNDSLVNQSLRIQWFGRPGPRAMIDRHHRTVPPLYKNGILFIPAEDRVFGVDGYNGTVLWDLPMPGSRRISAFRDTSYLAATDDALYIAAADRCAAVAPRGAALRVFDLTQLKLDPSIKQEWGYVAPVGGLLIGTAQKAGSTRRDQSRQMTLTETHYDFVPQVCGHTIFAMDIATGALKWKRAALTGAMINPTLAIADGKVYFVQSANQATLAKTLNRANLEELLGQGASLIALDIATGRQAWSMPLKDLTDLRHNLFLSVANGRVVLVGSRNSGTNKKIDKVVYEIHTFDAATGEAKWNIAQTQGDAIGGDHGEQERHPAIVGDRLYCEPYAYNLATGGRITWDWPWITRARRGCGTLSASACTLYFRDQNARAFDLEKNQVVPLTTDTRPGCWINMLPVGGLLLSPEASSGCSCNFAVQTSIGFIPVPGQAK